MTAAYVIELAVFASLMVGTPGPANVMMMVSGAHFGLRATLPVIAGLAGGQAALNVAVALGVLAVLSAHPPVAAALKIISGVYLLWLAWRMTGARLTGKKSHRPRRPASFLAGLWFPFLNPKAWAMSAAAYAQFTDAGSGDWLAQSAVLVAVFCAAQFVFHPLWCYGGQWLARRFAGTVWERVVMRAMALSLVALVAVAMLK